MTKHWLDDNDRISAWLDENCSFFLETFFEGKLQIYSVYKKLKGIFSIQICLLKLSSNSPIKEIINLGHNSFKLILSK